MKFWLIPKSSENTATNYSVQHEVTQECIVGRREGDLKFNDEILSGKHAKFFVKDEKFFVMDLGSSNGTAVNGRKILRNTAVELSHSDYVRVGNQFIKVKIEQPAVVVVAETPLVERTRIEPAESTRVESFVAAAEHTQVERQSTKPEILPEPNFLASPGSSIIIEQAKPVDHIFPTPSFVEVEEGDNTRNKRIFFEEIKKRLSTKQAIIGISLTLGVFAFLLLGGKKDPERGPASVELNGKTLARPTRHKNTTSPTPEENPSTSQSSLSSVETASSSVPETYSSDVAPAPETVEIIPPQQVEVAPQADVEVLPVQAPVSVPLSKAKSLKRAPKKGDAYGEGTLMVKLLKYKIDMKVTRSVRVRNALESDADELCARHYAKYRESIKSRWQNSRDLASSSRDKLKSSLQKQLTAVNLRERTVRLKLSDYLRSSKVNSPFPK